MNGEDEKWKIADNREEKVEENVKKRLKNMKENRLNGTKKKLKSHIIREDDAPFPNLITHIDRFDSENDKRKSWRKHIFSFDFQYELSPKTRFRPV